ncbi:MAG: MMPL family transporter [Pseudomonadales bacterium]|nr:MMPL family transporter [Pseudomonadales bacterium]
MMNISQSIIRNRLLYIVFSLGATLLAISGAHKLSLSVDYRAYFSDDNPQRIAYEQMQSDYSDNDNLLIAISSSQGNIFTPRTLAAVEQLTSDAWQIPYSSRVDSITNFQHTHGTEDDLIVEPLFENTANLTPEQFDHKKHLALNEPRLVSTLLSPGGQTTAINVTINLPRKNGLLETPEAVNYTRELINRYRTLYPTLSFHLSGQVMANNAFPEASLNDTLKLFPFVFGVMLLFLIFVISNVAIAVLILTVISLSVLIALGLVGWAGAQLTPDCVAGASMILPIAIADCVHLVTAYKVNHRQQGSVHSAMASSLKSNFKPILLTSVTTALSFLSLNFSDAPPYRLMGNIVAIGVIAAFFLSVFFLAPAVTYLNPDKMQRSSFITGINFDRLTQFVTKYHNRLTIGAILVSLTSLYLVSLNEINDNPIDWFSESIEYRSDTDWIDDNLTGVTSVQFSIRAAGEFGITEPEYLSNLERFGYWLKQQPHVRHVNVFSDIMKRLNRDMHNNDPGHYTIPGSVALASQYLLLYELSLPFGLDLTNQINFNRSATRVIVSLDKISAQEVIEFDQAAHAWLTSNTPTYMHTQGGSPAIMFAYLGQRNAASMLIGLIFSIITISAILFIALKSIRLGIISLLPNLLPAAIAFGLWGLFVGEVGIALSIVMGMTLGIVVDDSIHFLTKYQDGLKQASANPIAYAYQQVGPAIITTTIALLLGFSVLATSGFTQNAQIGLMTAGIVTLALLVDLFFLPAILIKFTPQLHRRNDDSRTQHNSTI